VPTFPLFRVVLIPEYRSTAEESRKAKAKKKAEETLVARQIQGRAFVILAMTANLSELDDVADASNHERDDSPRATEPVVFGNHNRQPSKRHGQT
jgi:hypothetical protein